MRQRVSIDETYLRIAESLADSRVYATRAIVGALLVKEIYPGVRKILAEGYNGMPAGVPNEEIEFLGDDGQIHTDPRAIHAEANVFEKLSMVGDAHGAYGATLYCTFSPCWVQGCTMRVINHRLKRVVFREFYRDRTGLPYLEKAGIELVQLAR